MPSLEQQAQRARRTIKNGLREHADYGAWPFPMERDIIVLWGLHHGWGPQAISRHIGCSATTVRSVRSGFHKDPSKIFLYPVMSGILRGGKVVWQCEACGLPLPGMSERKARIHVASHFVPDMVIQLNGVIPKPN